MAVGVIGMSMDDFLRQTPGEYEATVEAWSQRQEARNRDDWERMRMLASIVIQPHVKKRLTPKELLPFPWEERGKSVSDKSQSRAVLEKLLQKARR